MPVLGRDRRDLLDRLQRADLVVGHHQRDERHRRRVLLDRRPDLVGPHPAERVDGQPLQLGALVLRQPDGRVQYGVVLDPAEQDPPPARVLLEPGPPQALQREIVGLGPAGGEHHLARQRAERLRDRLPGLLDGPPGGPPDPCSDEALPVRPR